MVDTSLKNAFHKKKVLVTGHTGFKGAWLSLWLHSLGANVYGFSLKEDPSPSAYTALGIKKILKKETIADIRAKKNIQSCLQKTKPDFIFHLAAQSLVSVSYEDPLNTVETNILGTANLLESLRHYQVKNKKAKMNVIIVTSDKCYQNLEKGNAYVESDPMGGSDVYSMSKGATELLVHAWRKSFFSSAENIKIASARAGNVIGGGDFSKDRVLPDCVRSIRKKQKVVLRSPESIRPWQHVLEPLSGYLTLAAKLAQTNNSTFCDGWNFGPQPEPIYSVQSLVNEFYKTWKSAPGWSANPRTATFHEAKTLRLSIEKAEKELQWKPCWDVLKAVRETAEWYQAFENKLSSKKSPLASMQEFSLKQIQDYMRSSN